MMTGTHKIMQMSQSEFDYSIPKLQAA